MRALLATALTVLLVGCAAPGLYKWGGYDQALYEGYKSPAKMDALRLKLENHISAMEAAREKVAPGLYAELGTLLLQSGSTTDAIRFYKKERDAWPESTKLMTSLVQNLERDAQTQAGTSK